MSDYTIVNIREHEDIAPKFGMPEGMEARFPKQELGCEIGAVALETLAPGLRGPFGHRHKMQEELYVVVSGSGRVKLDDEIADLRQWDVLRVPPEVMRNFEAGPEGLEILAFGAPIADENDSELVADWWKD
ncbi:MAG TPA: cupin domain-containing protein [Gaiellaceae bacterium]|nr:cupin domain-containing protein [Gaiellaceae bacterium]